MRFLPTCRLCVNTPATGHLLYTFCIRIHAELGIWQGQIALIFALFLLPDHTTSWAPQPASYPTSSPLGSYNSMYSSTSVSGTSTDTVSQFPTYPSQSSHCSVPPLPSQHPSWSRHQSASKLDVPSPWSDNYR